MSELTAYGGLAHRSGAGGGRRSGEGVGEDRDDGVGGGCGHRGNRRQVADRGASADDRAVRPVRDGSYDEYQQHCRRAAWRVRRWLRPTSLRPPTSTSPAPTPSKQTSFDHAVLAIAPSWTLRSSIPVAAAIADIRWPPSHTIGPCTSSDHPDVPAGTITSIHVTSPGTSSTAPPPLRRRTTSTPARRHASTSTTDSCCVEPSTSADPAMSCCQISRCAGSGTGLAWNSAAVDRDRTRRYGSASVTRPAADTGATSRALR